MNDPDEREKSLVRVIFIFDSKGKRGGGDSNIRL